MPLQIHYCRTFASPSLTYRRRPAARRLHTTVQAMVKATWQGAVLATSNDTQQVEGNHYFPPESINKEHFKPSNKTTHCGWKGTASYYDVVADGQTNKDAAWYYAEPYEKATNIKDHVAFWRGVKVE